MDSVLLLIIAIIAGLGLGAPREEYELSFVTFVHRHGDRSPLGTFPTDPYGNESLWNNGWGELTNCGKQHAYDLGKWFRARYEGFLPDIYNKNDYEVQSTDSSRTLMTAYLVLAGLYEPTGSDIWNPDVKWQPIPVHTTPEALDNVLMMRKPCKRHDELLGELMTSEEMTNRFEALTPFLSDVIENAGINGSKGNNGPRDLMRTAVPVIDALYIQGLNGFELPKWAAPYYPEKMNEMVELVLRIPSYNRKLQRLYCGMLVKDIVKHFTEKSEGLLEKKIWQYSAHDITIVGLRQCLNLKERDRPPYASALILELRSKLGNFYVRTLYKKGDDLETLIIPGCYENCPLNQFIELTKPIIPKDWEEECN